MLFDLTYKVSTKYDGLFTLSSEMEGRGLTKYDIFRWLEDGTAVFVRPSALREWDRKSEWDGFEGILVVSYDNCGRESIVAYCDLPMQIENGTEYVSGRSIG